MILSFGGHEVFLHCSGVAIIRELGLAVVSDMHLEKSSHFARRGFFLPPYDSYETLLRLHKVLAEENVERLLILGDCFHDATGYERLTSQTRDFFDDLRRLQPIWITGNHDGDFVPAGFSAHDAYAEQNLIFRHQAMPGAVNEISGHFHPKAEISYKNARISKPCFVEDGRKLILPSFGAYTGGLFVDKAPIRPLFGRDMRFYLLGEKKVFAIPPDVIARA